MIYSENILALNSGGFDSIILCYYLKEIKPKANVICLFFNYGQASYELERKCAYEVCKKLGYTFKELTLPKFSWTNSEFYYPGFKDNEHQELEYRNLVFLSYAASIASSFGCTSVYAAFLKSLGYIDTSAEFIKNMENILSLKGISFETPFKDYNKVDLLPWVFSNEILLDDFCSCDTPINGKPCGECPDCKLTSELVKMCSDEIPVNRWIKTNDPKDFKFQEGIKNQSITEARLLINNSCQLKCKHCFYGFDEMISEPLSLDEYKKVIDNCINLGVSNFHFSGKEPLFNDIIFEYARYIKNKYPQATYEVVTNGINLPKFAGRIKELGFSKVYLSVDDVLNTRGLRNNSTSESLKAIKDFNLPCQVFIDLHNNNYDKLDSIIGNLYNVYGIKEFYIRNVHSIGSGKDIERLSLQKINRAYECLIKEEVSNLPVIIQLSLNAYYVYDLLEQGELPIVGAIDASIQYLGLPLGNLYIYPELFCGKYNNQITITPDGYVLGCGTEVSLKNYDKFSAGNVRNDELSNIVMKGKKSCIECNLNQLDKDGNILFKNCIHKPID